MDKRRQPHSEEHKRKMKENHLGSLGKRWKLPYKKRKPTSEETKIKIGLSNKGKKHSDETKKIIGEKGKGRPAWNKGKPSPWTSERNKLTNSQRSGENHWNWKGNISSNNCETRRKTNYVLWRKSCLERDNFTCQKTGQQGGKLEVHHINNFAEFTELRLSIENGITLSKETHKEFHHIYGRKNNTLGQLIEYLNL